MPTISQLRHEQFSSRGFINCIYSLASLECRIHERGVHRYSQIWNFLSGNAHFFFNHCMVHNRSRPISVPITHFECKFNISWRSNKSQNFRVCVQLGSKYLNVIFNIRSIVSFSILINIFFALEIFIEQEGIFILTAKLLPVVKNIEKSSWTMRTLITFFMTAHKLSRPMHALLSMMKPVIRKSDCVRSHVRKLISTKTTLLALPRFQLFN